VNIQPKDILKPRNVSGYAHVGLVAGPSRGANKPYYQAYANGGRRGDWKGPARPTAAEAAQDYCDYLNTGGVATPATLNSAGHKARRQRIIDEEERAALGVLRDKRAQRTKKAKGYVYCITDGTAVKIGYSLKPEARVGELQTGNPRRLRLLATVEGTPTDERNLHVKYLHLNILQEWFRPTKAVLSEFGLTKEAISA
jgi:hypothetical protein